ncbi:KIN14B-interacting protein At4g14310 [Sesamum indicum]|uniref:KIN14B-interacting protein At4g14310 n=1 Tax=Sesamum indicum TaxID=4182 RepID=A0A6I9TVY2_SESIN|nr:KIN14B-interacting protein At4g14310 [Sesamum indicum]
MSTSSARRMNERGGGGAARVAASTGKVTPVSGKSMSVGKENPRPASRVRAATQKPSVRPMARVDKSAAVAAEEPRVRKSTSSVPRGRSSSPSEFTRVLSDLKRNSRVSVGPSQRKISSSSLSERTGGKCTLEKRVSKDLEKNGGVLNELEGVSQENENIAITVVKNGVNEKKEGSLSSVTVKRSDLEKKVSKYLSKNGKTLDEVEGNNQQSLNMNIRVGSFSNEKKAGALSSISMKRSDYENLNMKSNSEYGAEVKSSEETRLKSSKENGANKYPSKLHEKLAFLEGKVKRIATDIKRTKEMLDMNNPDASKMILSDIQEKISGIEKAMGHVVGPGGDAKIVSLGHTETDDKEEENAVVDSKSLAKGLNVEELEARLFPHHKLIRDRTLSKTTFGESNSTLDVEEDKVISFDVNVIDSGFLASLSKKETEVGVEASKVQEGDDPVVSVTESSLNVLNGKGNIDALLMADENLNDIDDQERVPTMIFDEEFEDSWSYQLNDIGGKSSTGGWFVSEGESVLLAHDDGSCSFYDIVNCEEKAEYKPPAGFSPNMWRDCWVIRAPSADGCSGKYVVAASAGNSVDSGFCSWDFYTKDIRAFHCENETAHVRTALAPLSNNTMFRRNSLSSFMATENRQWWYKPCGPLIISTASCQRMVQIYDIRDGDQVMKWEMQKPVMAMDYASPLHWRNRGKVVIAESDAISLWDVGSLNSHALLSVSSSGRQISALHVNNTDAELGGGVRQRVSSSEAEGNDGVFCTPDSINVLDFRQPSGIGLKIPKVGVNVHSAFSRGDSIYIGCTSLSSATKKQSSAQIQHFSLRKQRLVSTYSLPESNAHHHFTALTQVWGNSNLVMGVCGLGLFVFDSLKDDISPSFSTDIGTTQNVKEIIGPDNMYSPSFDYMASRILLISRDRPACWRYLL